MLLEMDFDIEYHNDLCVCIHNVTIDNGGLNKAFFIKNVEYKFSNHYAGTFVNLEHPTKDKFLFMELEAFEIYFKKIDFKINGL